MSFTDNLMSQFRKFAQACLPLFLAFLRPVYLSPSFENHASAFWEGEGDKIQLLLGLMKDDLAWAVFML